MSGFITPKSVMTFLQPVMNTSMHFFQIQVKENCIIMVRYDNMSKGWLPIVLYLNYLDTTYLCTSSCILLCLGLKCLVLSLYISGRMYWACLDTPLVQLSRL